MDLKDKLKQLASRVEKMLPQIQTEEATKNALIMPFIQVLGYDVFNPFEVNPEFIADIGIKKGEKVDYAIMKDGEPAILIECKHHLENLDPHNSQLFRYFHTTKAKFSVLTNGVTYRFYTDLVEANKMDEKPFFEFTITDLKEAEIAELKKFHKSYFDIDNITNTASELKYSNEIKAILTNDLRSPSDNFVKYFTSEVYNGRATEKVVTQFREIVKRSANQLISDMISERLKSALNKEAETLKTETADVVEEEVVETKPSRTIITTEEELEGFYIVKGILRKNIESSRVTHRDTQTYFGILIDNNNRKPVCRLWLNGGKKYISVFDDSRAETKHEISCVDDIYNFSDQLINTAKQYL